MLGIGWTEMLVIGVVALIVIGPKELPALMNRIGKFAGTVRRMGSDFQREINKTTGLNEIKSLRDSVTAPLKTTADAIRREFNTTTSSGAVQPSGALKPADPKAESVVSEIHKAAGMTPIAKPTTPINSAESIRADVLKRVPQTTPVVAAPAKVGPVAAAAAVTAAKPVARKRSVATPAEPTRTGAAKKIAASEAVVAAKKPRARRAAATADAAPPKPAARKRTPAAAKSETPKA
jgi:sec-independent protein translocase protein TatB